MKANGAATPYRVLLVEDSPTMQTVLRQLLGEMGFVVAASASSVREAEALVRIHRPHLMLSDIHLGDGDGIQLARKIMATNPVPIVLITANDPLNPELIFQAFQAGALEVLPKPPGRHESGFQNYFDQCSRTLRTLAGIPVVRRYERHPVVTRPQRPLWSPKGDAPVIAIGASTGGPTVVADLVKSLESVTIQFCVIAQHMVPDFIGSFQKWLQNMTKRPVILAETGKRPVSGTVYVIPPHRHLEFVSSGWNVLPEQAVASAHIPSIDTLFSSLAREIPKQVVGLLLSGMGHDGATGLKNLKTAGAYTIVQDPNTAVLYSMPQSAIRMDAACTVMSSSEMLQWLRRPGWMIQ